VIIVHLWIPDMTFALLLCSAQAFVILKRNLEASRNLERFGWAGFLRLALPFSV
jgi:hypothetical protein